MNEIAKYLLECGIDVNNKESFEEEGAKKEVILVEVSSYDAIWKYIRNTIWELQSANSLNTQRKQKMLPKRLMYGLIIIQEQYRSSLLTYLPNIKKSG